MIYIIALHTPRTIAALIFAAFLAVTLPAAPAATFDFAAVYSNGVSYGWGDVNIPVIGPETSNWISPGNQLIPGLPGDIANITTPTNGLSIELRFGTSNQPQPDDFTLGILNLNAGPSGYYHIDSYANNVNYLIFDNSGATAQINVIGTDAGNDVISCGVNITSVLDISGGKLAISGPVVGGQLIVDASSLTLSGTNTHSSTVLRSGTLNVSSSANLGAAAGFIDFQGGTLHATANFTATQSLGVEAAGGVISLNPGTTLTFAGHVASSSGSLQVLGGGTLELATANPYTGGLVVDSSRLLVSNSVALGGTSGTLALNSSNLTTTASFSSNTHVTLSGSSVFVVADGTTLTAAGQIDGSGGLFSSGGGTLDIESPNSFTGGVYVSAGTLRVIGDTGLGDPANSIAIDSATLNVGESFNTNRGVVVNQATIKVDNTATFTISSQVTGAGLTKTGGGTLLLAHANSFTAPLVIDAGDVSVSADNVLGNAANSLSFNGGRLTVTAGFTTPRPVFLDTSGGTFSVSGSSSTLTASGQFTGPGRLTKTGPGTLVLANVDNFYDGGTDIIDGTLRIGADTMLGTAFRTLTFDDGSSPMLNTTADIPMSRPINLNNPSATFDVNAGTTLTLSGVISGGAGGLVKIGGGTLTLSGAGANTYSGSTTVNDGTLVVSTGTDFFVQVIGGNLTIGDGVGAAGSAVVTFAHPAQVTQSGPITVTINSDGVLNLREGGTIAPDILGPLVMSGGAVNTSGAPGQVICALTGNITTLASNTTATISGVTAVLSADSQTNTFMIAQGTTSNGIDLDVSADLGAACARQDRAGHDALVWQQFVRRGRRPQRRHADHWQQQRAGTGTLTAGGGTLQADSNGPYTVSNAVNLSSTLTVFNGGSLTLPGSITGSGGLVKNGGGTLTLSSAGANTYSGTTTVNDGTLVVSTGDDFFVQVIGGNLTIGDGVGAAGSAVVTFAHPAQVTQSGPITVTINSDGVLNLREGGTIAPDILGPLVMSGGAVNTSGAPGQVICALTGNITTLASNTTATISGVTAVLSADSQTNTFMIAQGTTSNGIDLDVSADLGGTALVKAGPGTLRLSGRNNYAGGTVLSQGGLDINSTNAIGSGPFSVSDGTTIDNTSGGAITLAANNRQTWGGSFTFAGTQSLNFGTGAVTLNANPTVTVSASTLTVGVVGDGTGNSLIKSGAGTLIVLGGALYTGTTAVNAGTLTINGAVFSSSASTVAAAATMNFVNGANAGNGTFANSARRTARSPAV